MAKRTFHSIWNVIACLILVPTMGQAQPGKSSPPSGDPFPAYSVWTNDSNSMTLTILERKGDTFRGKLVAGDMVERTFTGTVKDGRVAWLARDVKAVKGGQGGDNSGTLRGDQIDFEYRTGGGTGSFTLHRRDTRALHQVTLDDSTFEYWRDYLKPKSDELEWAKPDWKTSLAQAVIEGHRRDKPIFLWVAVGHPLCWT